MPVLSALVLAPMPRRHQPSWAFLALNNAVLDGNSYGLVLQGVQVRVRVLSSMAASEQE